MISVSSATLMGFVVETAAMGALVMGGTPDRWTTVGWPGVRECSLAAQFADRCGRAFRVEAGLIAARAEQPSRRRDFSAESATHSLRGGLPPRCPDRDTR